MNINLIKKIGASVVALPLLMSFVSNKAGAYVAVADDFSANEKFKNGNYERPVSIESSVYENARRRLYQMEVNFVETSKAYRRTFQEHEKAVLEYIVLVQQGFSAMISFVNHQIQSINNLSDDAMIKSANLAVEVRDLEEKRRRAFAGLNALSVNLKITRERLVAAQAAYNRAFESMDSKNPIQDKSVVIKSANEDLENGHDYNSNNQDDYDSDSEDYETEDEQDQDQDDEKQQSVVPDLYSAEKEHAKIDYTEANIREGVAFDNYFEATNRLKKAVYENQVAYNSYMALSMEITHLNMEKYRLEDQHQKSMVNNKETINSIREIQNQISSLHKEQSEQYVLFNLLLSRTNTALQEREQIRKQLDEARLEATEALKTWRNISQLAETDIAGKELENIKV
ncbi:MAG: hypothetical protein NkDv07_0720 [Candidatus Improbicoccus devescovinae]|nr:MAG: hypothetical protein NkDv07_0720 [Candidatus Improbicoccus devescovinae]